MAEKMSQTADIHAQVIRALLANGPALMAIAHELELSTREIRNILYETLLHLDGENALASDAIPVTAKTPGEVANLISGGLNLLRSGKLEP